MNTIRGGMTVSVKGWRGIAFNVIRRRGNEVSVVMVGDDRVRTVSVSDCQNLSNREFCGSCGQIGCGH